MPCTAASNAIGGTAAAPIWMTTSEMRQHRMGDIADKAQCGRTDQEAPEEPDGQAVVLRCDLGPSRSAQHAG